MYIQFNDATTCFEKKKKKKKTSFIGASTPGEHGHFTYKHLQYYQFILPSEIYLALYILVRKYYGHWVKLNNLSNAFIVVQHIPHPVS